MGGFFINLRGRENGGIVEPGEEYQSLKKELINKLTGLKDPITGETAIHRLYDINETCQGPYINNGPDLLFGFNPGYRISWNSVTGDTRGPIFSDNIKKWSGDHCLDSNKVKGIFFATMKITHDDPDLKDISATCMDLFGINPPAYVEGRPLMKE